MSIKSSSRITNGLPLDDEKPSSVKTDPDRTTKGMGQTARTRVTGSSPLRGSSPITRVPGSPASPASWSTTEFDGHRPALLGGYGQRVRDQPDHRLNA